MNKFSPFRMSPIESFRLNLEVFCSGHYKVTKEVKSKIGEFLIGQGQTITIREAYTNLIRSQEDPQAMLRAFSSNPLNSETFWDSMIFKEVTRQLYTIPHIVNDSSKINWYSFPYFENDFSSFSDVAVILNTDFDLNYSVLTHQSLFRLIFASILSQTDNPESFLIYQLEKSFNNKLDAYSVFLGNIADDHADIIQARKKFFKEWRKANLSNPEQTKIGVNTIVISYIIKFRSESLEFIEVKDLYLHYSDRFKEIFTTTPGSLKTTYYRLNKENDSYHLDNKDSIKLAIRLIEPEYVKSIKFGKQFLKNLR